jgi:hypothetical protein
VSVCDECFVLSGSGLCDRPSTHAGVYENEEG